MEWSFSLKTIETFNFGTDFQKWIRVIYSNISSCTINNGHVSPFFLLHRGVRQGCPISGMLFVLAVELLSCAIRSDNKIEGIKVNGEEIKLSQYADDTTSFIKDQSSLKTLLELLDQFKECSGLKMNKSKSEAMWLGKDKDNKDELYDLKWPQTPIIALGTAFQSYDKQLCEQENFLEKITKAQKICNMWRQRDLTLYGRITIVKTLGLSKLISSSACLPTPPYVVTMIDKLVSAFVWNNKPPKIKRGTMIGPKEKGGLDLPDYDSIRKSLLAAWTKRMINGINEGWMAIHSLYLDRIGGFLIFDCNYNTNLLNLQGMPQFYVDVLKAWGDVIGDNTPQHCAQVKDEILWNNRYITIAGKSVYYKDLHLAGITKVKDLLNDNNELLSINDLIHKIGVAIPFTKLLGLIDAIPADWKRKLKICSSMDNKTSGSEKAPLLPANGVSCGQARRILIVKKWIEPLANDRLRRLGVHEEGKINEIHSLAFKITKETKLSIFQFKLVHNILPHRILQHKMGIVDSPRCLDCNNPETVLHMLVSCPMLEMFWSNALSWWNTNSVYKVSFNEFNILFGYNADGRKTYLLNYYFLTGKFYIFRQKTLNKAPPTFTSFLAFLKEKVFTHKAFTMANGTSDKFQATWTTLLSLLNE